MSPLTPKKSLSAAITSEGGLIETPGLDLLDELGWKHVNLMHEEPGPANPTGRLTLRELILPARFRAALRELNPALPFEALQEAELAVTANRSAMLPITANRDVYRLLREGVRTAQSRTRMRLSPSWRRDSRKPARSARRSGWTWMRFSQPRSSHG
jgi:type I restriction enzyme, R subunit